MRRRTGMATLLVILGFAFFEKGRTTGAHPGQVVRPAPMGRAR